MNRSMTRLGTVVAVVASTTFGMSAAAGALGGGTQQCKAVDAKPIVHAAAVRREATLATLVAKLQARKDPFGMNGAQLATLQSASTAISALDAKIQATCYPTRAAFHTDA